MMLTPLFETIVKHVKQPDADFDGPFQMQISQLDYNSYVGVIGVGRITRGSVKTGKSITVVSADGSKRSGKIGQVLGYMGLARNEVESASAGDIVAITGLGELKISDTICDPNKVEALKPLSVDEPTVTMTFQVNNSPFAGKEGKYVTSRNILDRLKDELIHNVALRVDETEDADKFRVSGRGELHLGILIENMRREGYELAVSRPEVILRTVNGVLEEPFETVTIDCEEQHQGSMMEQLGMRKGEMTNMTSDGKGRVRLDFIIPSRGLIGFQTDFMTMTSGSGLLYHTFDHYGPHKGGSIGQRKNGVLIANATGKALTNALFNMQERGRLFIGHGVEVYEGMVIGMHNRDNDLTVNALKGKQLTNVRASGTDEAQSLVPPVILALEQALEFIDNDELVEVTPKSIRIRKKHLTENDRKRASRGPKD
jgi:GTP-binding protein